MNKILLAGICLGAAACTPAERPMRQIMFEVCEYSGYEEFRWENIIDVRYSTRLATRFAHIYHDDGYSLLVIEEGTALQCYRSDESSIEINSFE